MNVICPKCLTEACVTVDVNDGDTLGCPECNEEYSLGDVAAMLTSWGKILPWLKSHPARTPAEVPA